MTAQSTSRAGRAMSADHLAARLAGWADVAHGNLAQRLARAIRLAIDAGTLPEGERLPSERSLAAALAVSRATVSAALDELRSQGVVVSRQGSGTVVRGDRAPTIRGTRIADHLLGTGPIDLLSGNPPDASHLPPLRLDVATLLASDAGTCADPLGLASLRSAIAEMCTAQGRVTDPAQIHVTNGSHHALSLAATALAGRGSPIVMEEPGYAGIFDIVDTLGATAVPVRSDHHGIVPDHLDRLLAERRPAFVFVQLGPQNPTGRVPSPTRLRELAEVVDRHGTTVVEDAALAEVAFEGRIRPELSELCRRAPVVSLGSLSKVAWAGLRLGWMRAPAPFIERTMYLRLNDDLGTSAPSQLLALQLLPHLEEIIAERRRTLGASIDRSLAHLAAELPEWEVRRPAGGSVLWVRLPLEDSGPFVALAARHGVQIGPGSLANADRRPDPHVRICVDRPWPTVEAGFHRLGLAWREVRETTEA